MFKRLNSRYILLLNSIIFVCIISLLSVWVCPYQLRAVNSIGPLIEPNVISEGYLTYIIYINIYILAFLVTSLPYRVYIVSSSMDRKTMKKILKYDSMLCYIPLAIVSAIMYSIYTYYLYEDPMYFIEHYLIIVTINSVILTSIQIYISIYSIPASIIKSIPNRKVRTKAILFIGFSTTILSKIMYIVVLTLLTLTLKPITIYYCSVENYGIEILNPEATSIIEQSFSVSIQGMIASTVFYILYFAMLNKFVEKYRGY